MKKVVGAFVLTVVLVAVLCVSTGCSMSGNNTQQSYDDSALLAEIENLKDRVDELESKNNVFWTDKAEYAENETMTIYLKNEAICSIRLNSETGSFGTVNDDGLNGRVYVTSFIDNMRSDTMIAASYVLWENGMATRDVSTSPFILNKNEESVVPGIFSSKEDVRVGDNYSYVICLPGTLFELARFTNITVRKGI